MSDVLTVKKSVTIPEDLVAEAESRSGVRGFSTYVTAALENQLRLDRLRDLVEAARTEHGAVPDEVAADLADRVRAADAASGYERP